MVKDGGELFEKMLETNINIINRCCERYLTYM